MKLNQWQREILRLEKQSDKNLNRKLYNAYNDALKEVRKRLKAYMDEYEDLPYYKQQQAGRLSALEKEIVELLNGAYPKAKHEVTEFKQNELVDGYYTTMYQIEAETGSSLGFLGLDKEFVRQSVINPIAGKTLSKRLYSSRTKLANRATSEIRNGLMNGKSYAEIADSIQRHTEANYNQAVRIARTEGGRLRSMSKQVAYEEAQDLGIDLKKMWMSALDNRTRSSHRALDGQTVGVDEEFKSHETGAKGLMPRMLGRAEEDINCRCTTVTVVDGIAPDSRIDVYGNEFPYKNYNQWKKDLIKKNGQKWWDIEEVKVKNFSKDEEMFGRYKSVLGAEMPTNVYKFQDLKYNDNEKWQRIQDHYFVKSRLKDGRYGSILNPDKQSPHLELTQEEGKSYFFEDVDAQALFDKYAGTGKVDRDRKEHRTNTETITLDADIGLAVSEKRNEVTNRIRIHHSKIRTHISPIFKE